MIRLILEIMIIQNHNHNHNQNLIEFFQKIYHEGLKMNDKDISDQKLFNNYIREYFPTNKYITILDRVLWNAFPIIEDIRYKYMMGYTIGDEIMNSSHIVHFAGIYGGASQEKGFTEPVSMLVVYRELIIRQISFLLTLSYEATLSLGLTWEKTQVNVHRKLTIVKKYESMKLTLDECISRVDF